MLTGLVIVSALLSLGFAIPAMRADSVASVWDVGFVGSVLTFLTLFVRLLLRAAQQRIDDDTPW